MASTNQESGLKTNCDFLFGASYATWNFIENRY